MKVRELRATLERLEEEGHADDGVTVHAFGGMRGFNAEITSADVGFDWDSGQVVLRTKPQLGLWRSAHLPKRTKPHA